MNMVRVWDADGCFPWDEEDQPLLQDLCQVVCKDGTVPKSAEHK